MVVTFVIYEIRRVVVRALAIADSKDAKPYRLRRPAVRGRRRDAAAATPRRRYVEFLMDTWRLWPIRVVLWALTMALVGRGVPVSRAVAATRPRRRCCGRSCLRPS